MFETRIQTYWADSDAAGIAYHSHFFRFVECAEEDLFRAGGMERQQLLEENQVWLPRAESFARFVKPINVDDAILVRLKIEFKGGKTIKCGFEVLEEKSRDLLSEGYVTIVCVNRETFKATELPDPIRAAFKLAEEQSSVPGSPT